MGKNNSEVATQVIDMMYFRRKIIEDNLLLTDEPKYKLTRERIKELICSLALCGDFTVCELLEMLEEIGAPVDDEIQEYINNKILLDNND